MTSKSQELELRNIMEGLQEFATFMSYQSDYQGLRILSVESVKEAEQRELETKATAKILPFNPSAAPHKTNRSEVYKELKFYDQVIH